jgi:hypothetical protein
MSEPNPLSRLKHDAMSRVGVRVSRPRTLFCRDIYLENRALT